MAEQAGFVGHDGLAMHVADDSTRVFKNAAKSRRSAAYADTIQGASFLIDAQMSQDILEPARPSTNLNVDAPVGKATIGRFAPKHPQAPLS